MIIIIGVALAAFVLGDFVKSGPSGGREINIGIVNGEEITIMDFNKQFDRNIEATKQQQNKERLSQDETFTLRNDTWQQMVSQILYTDEYEELGVEVTSEELFDLIQGPNPHQMVKQSFSNPETGQFDRNLVVQFLQNVNTGNVRPEIKQQWIAFEEYILKDRLREKYNSLIINGYYVPKTLARLAFEEENNKADFNYVAKAFKDIPDSAINLTDEVYEKFYEEKKESYKQAAFRDFEYVVFDIVPSVKDIQDTRKEMNQLYESFKTTTDNERFVLVNSDSPYDSTWHSEGQLPVQIDSLMFNSEIGTVAKPFLVNNTFFLSKLVDIGYRPDSMKATHILISYAGAMRAAPEVKRTKEAANLLADSLYKVLTKSSNNIEELAVEFSNDPSAQTNDGDLGWFADGAMVPAFNKAVLDTKVGGVTIAETPFGFHIIKVTGKKDPVKKVRVATIAREVLISNDTYQQIYAKASKLASESSNIEEFNALVESERLSKRVAQKIHQMDNHIAGLNAPRQIVLWSFKEGTEVGNVSDEVFDLDGQFVVAVLTAKGEEGIPPLEEVKLRLNSTVYNHLKSEIILSEMEALGNDMDRIANAEGFRSEEIPAQTFASSNILGFGAENEIIGHLFGAAEGSTFGPVVGNGGVFITRLNKLTLASEKDNYTETINKLVTAYKNRINQGASFRALEEAADIVDNRAMFY